LCKLGFGALKAIAAMKALPPHWGAGGAAVGRETKLGAERPQAPCPELHKA
jgi:hypothetical protein